jgi:hypothetical protein
MRSNIMKKIWLFLVLWAVSALFSSLYAQNSNEGLPDNVRKPSLEPYDIVAYYGFQLPGGPTAAMRHIEYFETVTDDLLVYPNPTVGITHIRLHEPSPANVFVLVLNMNGNIMRMYQYMPGTLELHVPMNPLPAGLYSVRVWGPGVSFHNQKVWVSN